MTVSHYAGKMRIQLASGLHDIRTISFTTFSVQKDLQELNDFMQQIITTVETMDQYSQ